MKLIKGATALLDGQLKKADILFDEKGISKIAENISEDVNEIIDGTGLTALPGLIDVHVHLREPGNEHKETIKTGTMAAAAGGFTTVMAMPNVVPFPDDLETVREYKKLIDKNAVVKVIPYCCITDAEKGSSVVDMKVLAAEEMRYFSDDGVGVQKDEVMEEAMTKASEIGAMIVAHTEDMKYRKPKACMHEGKASERLGLIGIPSECEWVQLKRDLELAEKTGVKYHCCHMSAKESVELIREYKAKGCDVSGEVAAHHLLLTDEDVKGPNWKMNPPLRTEEDRQALIKGLLDGTIECIANDHAPHTEEEKARGMAEAPFGIVSLETAFPLLYTRFVKEEKIMELADLIRLMALNPAKRFDLGKTGELKEGYESDIILVDFENEFEIDKEKFLSMGKNTPFDGYKAYGKVKKTFVKGELVYKED